MLDLDMVSCKFHSGYSSQILTIAFFKGQKIISITGIDVQSTTHQMNGMNRFIIEVISQINITSLQ